FLGAGEGQQLDSSVNSDGLVFLAAIDYPPFSFMDSTGKLNGFNVYLARAVCEELGYTTNCIASGRKWEELESDFRNGLGNVLISGLAPTSANQDIYTFTKPFLRFPGRFVSGKVKVADGDLDKGLGKTKVGVVSNSAFAAQLKAFFPGADIVSYAQESFMLADLQEGRINLIFGDGLRLSFWLGSQENRSCCSFVGGPYYSDRFLGEGMRFAVSASNRALAEQLNSALISLQKKGKIDELFLRFFPVSFY
ncbi:MAG: transporter substrate-binding domain-containing protein, partial [Rhizobiaceae bacterium]